MLIFCHLFELYFYCECEHGHDGRECGRGNFFVAASASLICCWGVRRGAGGSGYDDGHTKVHPFAPKEQNKTW